MPIPQALGILILVGGIILIRAFARQMRNRPAPRPVDDGDLVAMNALLIRMEDRIATLERILDADDPKWRSRI